MIHNKTKTIQSKIAPNPNEAAQWVDLSADPYGTVIKTYNGKEWVNESDETAKVEALRKETNNKFAVVDKKIKQNTDDIVNNQTTLENSVKAVTDELAVTNKKIEELEKKSEETKEITYQEAETDKDSFTKKVINTYWDSTLHDNNSGGADSKVAKYTFSNFFTYMVASGNTGKTQPLPAILDATTIKAIYAADENSTNYMSNPFADAKKTLLALIEPCAKTEQITTLQQTISALQARIEVLENQNKTE